VSLFCVEVAIVWLDNRQQVLFNQTSYFRLRLGDTASLRK